MHPLEPDPSERAATHAQTLDEHTAQVCAPTPVTVVRLNSNDDLDAGVYATWSRQIAARMSAYL